MEKLQLLEKVLKLFTWKNKAFTAIGKELSDAFSTDVLMQYDRFKHWFVKEDPTAAAIWKKYEDKPEANAPVVQSIAEDKLNADPVFAQTLQQDIEMLETKYYDVINRIGSIEGEDNSIWQGSGNIGATGKTRNEIEQVKGNKNTIVQGSHLHNPPKNDGNL